MPQVVEVKVTAASSSVVGQVQWDAAFGKCITPKEKGLLLRKPLNTLGFMWCR